MATMRALTIPALSLLLVTAGCKADAQAGSSPFSAKDSSGVQLVRNGGPSGRPSALLETTETLRIGVADENAEGERFFRVTALVVDDSGHIYVGDESGTVRVFDAAGKRIRSLGHKGRGPGEFQNIGGIFLRGDTVEIMDSYSSRLARFDSSGRLVGEERMRDERSIVMPLARIDSGYVAAFQTFNPQERIGLVQDTLTLRRITKLGDAFTMKDTWKTATTPSQAINVPWMRLYHLKGGYAETPLWEPQPAFAADAAGRIYVTNGADYAITTFDADGNVVRRVEREHTPVPLPKGIDEQYFSKVKAKYDTMKGPTHNETGPNGETVEAPTEMARKTMPHRDVLPTLGKMLVSRDGAIWVQRPDLSDEPLLLEWVEEGRPDFYWDVFDKDGRYRGTVKIPKNFSSRAVTSNSIIGVSRNADDVESIVAYSIKQ